MIFGLRAHEPFWGPSIRISIEAASRRNRKQFRSVHTISVSQRKTARHCNCKSIYCPRRNTQFYTIFYICRCDHAAGRLSAVPSPPPTVVWLPRVHVAIPLPILPRPNSSSISSRRLPLPLQRGGLKVCKVSRERSCARSCCVSCASNWVPITTWIPTSPPATTPGTSGCA